MQYCIHGLLIGYCATCRAINAATDHGLFHPGCICPPTSEQTCQNPSCPRLDQTGQRISHSADTVWNTAIEACVRKVEAAPLFEVSSDVTVDERTTILDILRKHIRSLLRT